MFAENAEDVHNCGASNPAQLETRSLMTNVLHPGSDFKSSEADCCEGVAAGVADDVAAETSPNSLISADVADVAGEPGDPPKDQHPPEDGAALFDEITNALLLHVVMTKIQAQAVALWIGHAHTIDAHRHTPRLAITSPIPNCGKTTLCSVIGLLTGSPVVSNTTIAAFFRRVDREGPRPVILDEVDTFLSADNRRGIGILNAGHAKAGAHVEVAEATGEGFEPKRFCVWAPVVFGLIGKLPVATLESRSLNILLKRKRPDERVEPIRPADEKRLHTLKIRAIRWGARVTTALRDADPSLPACLYNRDRDNWRPLIAVADAAGGHWPQTAREIAAALNGRSEDPSEGVMLLADIRQVFEEKVTDRLPTQSLLTALCANEDRPWHDYQDQSYGITDKQLARLLRVFGIHPNSVRLPDSKTPKGYMRAWFEDAFDRYLPVSRADPASAATSATVSPLNRLQVAPAATTAATAGATELQQAVN